jgi:methylase of polypeptide subunit release factors
MAIVIEDAFLDARSVDDYADFLTPHLSSESHLLDLGCGTGALALGLAARTGRVTGLDTDADDLAEARAHADRLGVTKAEFREGSAYGASTCPRSVNSSGSSRGRTPTSDAGYAASCREPA